MSSRTSAAGVTWTVAMTATVAVALVLRTIGLGSGLWYDEIVTLVESARLPLAAIATTFPGVNAHPLYSLLAHLSITTFGESNWALRLPAAVFGTATVVATWALGRQMLSRAEAWAAAAVLATSYHHIWFSQNARGYTLLGLATIISTHLLLGALRTGATRTLVAYALVCALGVYTHMTMAFVVAGHAAVVAVCLALRLPIAEGWPAGRLAAAGAGATLLSMAAYLPYAADVARALTATAPHQAAQVATAGWALGEVVRSLFEGAGAIATLAGGVVAAIGGLSLLRRKPLEAALLAVPAFLTLAALVGLGQPVRPRFFFFVAGAAALCVGRGFGVAAEVFAARRAAMNPEPSVFIVVVCALLLVAASLPALARNYQLPKQDFDGAVAYLDGRAGAGAQIAAAGPACLPIEKYYERAWPCLERDGDWNGFDSSRPLLIVYTLRDYIADPAVAARIASTCAPLRTFAGTLGGGDITVCDARRGAENATGAGGGAALR